MSCHNAGSSRATCASAAANSTNTMEAPRCGGKLSVPESDSKEVSLKEMLRTFLEDSDYHDVVLQGTDGTRIPANRKILSARSSVFRGMLLGQYKESKAKVVQLSFPGAVVGALVEYIHVDRAQILKVPKTRDVNCSNVTIQELRKIQILLSLCNAAHYFHLPQLQAKTQVTISKLLTLQPALCVAIFDATTSDADTDAKPATDTSSADKAAPEIVDFTNEPDEVHSCACSTTVFAASTDTVSKGNTTASNTSTPPSPPLIISKAVRDLALLQLRCHAKTLLQKPVVAVMTRTVLENIITHSHIRLDEYKLFELLQLWASTPPVALNNTDTTVNSNSNNTPATTTIAAEAAPTYCELSPDELVDDQAVAPELARRHDFATALTRHLKLERIDPEVLATTVSKSGFVNDQQLLKAFQKQAMEAQADHGVRFKRMRYSLPIWRHSQADLVVSDNNNNNEPVADQLTCAAMSYGIWRWTIDVEREDKRTTWLGVASASSNFKIYDNIWGSSNVWLYGASGKPNTVSELVVSDDDDDDSDADDPPPQQVTFPPFASDARLVFTLDLRRNTTNGALYVVNAKDHLTNSSSNSNNSSNNNNDEVGEPVRVFSQLWDRLSDLSGVGFVPVVQVKKKSRIRLVDFEQLDAKEFDEERMR